MSKKITVILVDPNKKTLDIRDIDNDYQVYGNLVDGYFEVVPFQGQPDIAIICNDEGKLRHMTPNIFNSGDVICGPVVIAAFNRMRDDFRSLNHMQITNVLISLAAGMIIYADSESEEK